MPNKLSRFWQDLKRRNVIRVITVYTGAAFVILSLVDMIREPFELPNWSFKLVVVILSVGLIIAVILSWIYDIHPEGGIVKTEPAGKIKPEEPRRSSNNWKIASYISFVVIVGLIVLNVIPHTGKKENSIAVLPFKNISGDPGQDYMCEGLTNDVISHLLKVKTFDDVKGLTAVLHYTDSDKGPSEIAQELNVNYILEGTYRRTGDKLNVTASLIEAKSGNVIWTHNYDPPYIQVMEIPGDIALHIADHLRAFMTEGERQSINRMPTNIVEAYEIGNQVTYQFRRLLNGNLTSVDTIIELSNRAINLDPDYAEAYASLGIVTLMNFSFAGNKEVSISEVVKAEKYLKKARELDPYNLTANFGLALLNSWVKREYVEWEEFKKAFPNALNNRMIAGQIANFELEMGNYKEVLSIYEKDTAIDDTYIKANILLGNYTKAKKQIPILLDAVGQFSEMYTGEEYIWLQEFDSALYYLESAANSSNMTMFSPRYMADMAVACFKTGNQDKARSIIGKLIEATDTTTVGSPAYFIGWYYSWIGERDSAFYWLEKAFENSSPELPWLKVDPAFKSLQDDPHYLDLYERTGHKAYDDYMARQNR